VGLQEGNLLIVSWKVGRAFLEESLGCGRVFLPKQVGYMSDEGERMCVIWGVTYNKN